MGNNEPNPIKSYYIAYFDILGYKDYFENNPDKVADFLEMIHTGIQETKNKISGINQSMLASSVALMSIEIRIFSDNILLCMEEMEIEYENVRLLSFIMMVAEIQRGFITQCSLFVRGAITKGMLSMNADYVFGKGLIDAVTLEENTVYPRIEILPDLVNKLSNVSSCTQEEIKQAIAVEQRIVCGDKISDKECDFYNRILLAFRKESMFKQIVSSLVLKWSDGKRILSYLFCLDIKRYISHETRQMVFEVVKNVFPSDEKYLNVNSIDLDGLLKQHKDIIEEKLKKYGHNDDIITGDTKTADARERILKKYIWVMAYHNFICEYYKRPCFKILTRCNCDTRFLKITIEILE